MDSGRDGRRTYLETSVQEVERIRSLLKHGREGPEVIAALRRRLEIHLVDPMMDPLSRQVWEAYLKLPDMLEEPFSILDAGCLSGFLYHHLKRYKKDFTYTGIDVWPAAIMVAKEYAPGVDFRIADFLSFSDKPFDYVWCCNIKWDGSSLARARKNLIPLAKKKCIFVHPGSVIEEYGN